MFGSERVSPEVEDCFSVGSRSVKVDRVTTSCCDCKNCDTSLFTFSSPTFFTNCFQNRLGSSSGFYRSWLFPLGIQRSKNAVVRSSKHILFSRFARQAFYSRTFRGRSIHDFLAHVKVSQKLYNSLGTYSRMLEANEKKRLSSVSTKNLGGMTSECHSQLGRKKEHDIFPPRGIIHRHISFLLFSSDDKFRAEYVFAFLP